MVALTERKDVGKKWGCSQLMFTFAAEWIESELRLDDAESREGKWFPFEEMDAMVKVDSPALDPPLSKVWASFRAKERWFKNFPHVVDVGYEARKRYYMGAATPAPATLASSASSSCTASSSSWGSSSSSTEVVACSPPSFPLSREEERVMINGMYSSSSVIKNNTGLSGEPIIIEGENGAGGGSGEGEHVLHKITGSHSSSLGKEEELA